MAAGFTPRLCIAADTRASATNTATCSDMSGLEVTADLKALLQQQLQSPDVNIAKVSIALGALEVPLTKKAPAQRVWPSDLQVRDIFNRDKA